MHTIAKTTPDIQKERLATLKKLFPDLFTSEGKLNEEELRDLVSNYSLPQVERYAFHWSGKIHSKKLAFTSSKATLIPDEKKSKDFASTENVIIEGDNLEVLKLLYKPYFNAIKCIYIDPPYNTGNDFIYNDNYSESKKAYWEKNGVVKEGVRMDSNGESLGRYHSNWLNMMQSRLLVARGLLRDDGVIFVSIDDHEVANLRKLMDEVFGEENFVAQFIHKNNSSKNQAKLISVSTEYLLCFTKDLEILRKEEWRLRKKGADDIVQLFKKFRTKGLSLDDIEVQIKEMYSRPKYAHLSRWNKVDNHGVFVDADLSREGGSMNYTIINPISNKPCVVPSRGWGKSYEELLRLQKENLIWYGDENTPPRMKDYITNEDTSVPDTFLYYDNSVDTRMIKEMFGSLIFENPKPLEMIKQVINMGVKNNDIVLDFFAGSGTTAQAVMELNKEDGGNRKFILVQIPEVIDKASEAYKAGFKTISDICIERVKRAGEKMGEAQNQDRGYKVFRLTYSNFLENLFAPDPNKTEEENIKAFDAYIDKAEQTALFDLEPEKLLYEIALKDGFTLNFKQELLKEFTDNVLIKIKDANKEVILCLDETITTKTVDQLASYGNNRFICLERAVDTTKKWYLGKAFNTNLLVV